MIHKRGALQFAPVVPFLIVTISFQAAVVTSLAGSSLAQEPPRRSVEDQKERQLAFKWLPRAMNR